MPYEFKIGQLSDVFIGTHGDYIVDFDLGEDSDDIAVVQMMVGLTEDDHSGSDPFELLFGIRRRFAETGVTTLPRYDHATACEYIPKSQRNAVMLLILASVRKLVQHVNPDTVIMVTYEADLPAVAMGKYMSICNHMGLLGYTQTEYRRDGTDLKDYWLFTK